MTADVHPAGGYARIYDRLYRLGYHRNRTKSHAKVLAPRCLERWRPQSVLDVGCSLGWTLDYFTREGVANAVGVDVSEIAARKGRALGRDIRVSCASRLPFEDDAFDAVLSTDCLEHLREDDARRAVSEMCRVARRGIAVKVNPRLDRDRWWQFVARAPLHLTLRPTDAWLRWFEEDGWVVVEGDDEREEYLLEPRTA